MKLPIVCSQCMAEDVSTAHPIGVVSFRDDGRYEVLCPKGHTSITILQQQKFEVLFDIEAYAIVDGYYREAVSSFTSSLERFYEFVIKASLFEKGIDEKAINEKYPNGVDRTISLHLAQCINEKDKEKPRSTMSISTIISLSVGDPGHDERPLEKALQDLYRWTWNDQNNTIELLRSKPSEPLK